MSIKNGNEIERKFLVTPDIFEQVQKDGKVLKNTTMAYFYLCSGDEEIRCRRLLRLYNDRDNVELGWEYTMCKKIKSADPLLRDELEFNISKETFYTLNKVFGNQTYDKIRVDVQIGDLKYELDQYLTIAGESIVENDSLVCVVEIEFNSIEEANAFVFPYEYIQEFTGKHLTDILD